VANYITLLSKTINMSPMLMVLQGQTFHTHVVTTLFGYTSQILVTNWEKMAAPLSFKYSKVSRISCTKSCT
jgi:hypothetical protein